MPWRLIVFLIVLALVVAFAGFNIQNTASISFGFYTLEAVPVFLSLFAAFFLGILVMLPFTLGKRRGKGKQTKNTSTSPSEAPKLSDESAGGASKRRRKKGKNAAEEQVQSTGAPKA
jgi:uncharacterized integral membrane protein